MNKIASGVLVVGLILFAGLFPLNAQGKAVDDTHLTRVYQLFETLELDKLMQTAMQEMLDLQYRQNPFLKDYKEVMESFMSKYMSYEVVKEELAEVYLSEFTIEEIDDLMAFYQTETGKKAIRKMPILFQKGAAIGQRRVQENIAELEAGVAARKAELDSLQGHE